MIRVSLLENGLTRIFDDGSKLWGLYDTTTGTHRAGFEFAQTLEQVMASLQVHNTASRPLLETHSAQDEASP